mmetsp:Transcript_78308/g.138298  ORF Transcript_78308/g.138298 Transcript_78308/m.138298 type:complete len:228 (-) Transcript_78308:608-1291(-)
MEIPIQGLAHLLRRLVRCLVVHGGLQFEHFAHDEADKVFEQFRGEGLLQHLPVQRVLQLLFEVAVSREAAAQNICGLIDQDSEAHVVRRVHRHLLAQYIPESPLSNGTELVISAAWFIGLGGGGGGSKAADGAVGEFGLRIGLTKLLDLLVAEAGSGLAWRLWGRRHLWHRGLVLVAYLLQDRLARRLRGCGQRRGNRRGISLGSGGCRGHSLCWWLWLRPLSIQLI